MNLKRNFIKGRQNKDVDIRLLPKGEYREAYGIEIINSENSDIGAIEPMYSNRQLTNYNLGDENDIYHLGNFSDEFRKKIYWLVLSKTGSFIFEWDDINQIQSIVLADTRPASTRVFSLNKDHFVTGIEKVITQRKEDDLLLITDDNMQPLCINIERAKSYGINGFEEEDIFLIKKPPRKAPKTTPTFTNDGSNNIEEQFFLFAYRYRYLDGEYSAPSDFSNYVFTPKPFELDYFTLDNLGMVNNNNAVKIEFNTGKKQVTEIQVLVKESMGGPLKIIETYNKKDKGWGDNLPKSLIFSNNKTIIPLPGDQLLRSFDNVPKKAKALSLIENIPVFSNYTEGYNIEDDINFTVSLDSESIEDGDELFTLRVSEKLFIENPNNFELFEGRQLIIQITTEIDGLSGYSNTFFFPIEEDFTSLINLFESNQFQNFIDIINTDFQINFNQEGNYVVPPNYTLQDDPTISFANESGAVVLNITPVRFTDSDNNDELVTVPITFTEATSVSIIDEINSRSCKTNRNYEVGLVYKDSYGRRSTVLTSDNNTLYVPQEYSIFRNSIVLNIEHKAPEWADQFKVVFKSNPLSYQTIYITEFYSENFYSYCKLESNNKDKVVVGDFLVIKKAGENIISQPIKIKVLAIENKEEDFIIGDEDSQGNDITQPAGLYMKIKPSGFSMDRDDFQTELSEAPKIRSSATPTTYLDLFTNSDVNPIEELAIPVETSITLSLHSWREYRDGQANIVYEKRFFAQRNYASLEEWFEEVIFSRNNLYATDIYGPEDRIPDQYDYLPSLSLERGVFVTTPFGNVFQSGNNLNLEVEGAFSGGSGDRKGNVIASITVRIGSGFFVFETLPQKADTDIFYETEQSFEIQNNNHLSGQSDLDQDQDISTGTSSIIKTDFFNCYTQGQGVESYRVRDNFNSKHLTVDTRPSSTSVEKYREIRRFADQTYGKPYVESTNINGLNEFNLSTANFKELDKQYGSIQYTLSREGNILVLQQEKNGYVLFGKDLITSANGASAITTIPEILGRYVPYAGSNGVGENPESVAVDSGRVYWISSRRGTPVRLSADGVSEINYGMSSEFRNLLKDNPTSKKLGAYDPYFKKYVVNIQDEVERDANAFCGNIIQKTITEEFSFTLNINRLLGETTLNFDVTDGEVNIEVDYDGVTYTENNITEDVSITIPRTDVSLTEIQVTVTPVTETATVQITNVCPVGIPLKVISIVLADEDDLGDTIINRYKWGAGSFYSENHLFENTEVSQYVIEEGLEGTSKFPERNTSVTLQSFKDVASTGSFDAVLQNKLGYLISSTDYVEADIATILSNATFVSVQETQTGLSSFINEGSFSFTRPTGNENLYLIWDYRNVDPIVAVDDSFSINKGASKILDIVLNDINPSNNTLTIIIENQPSFGTINVLSDNTIEYIHNDSENFQDSFTYKLTDGSQESNIATVNLNVGVSVGDSVTASGGTGVFLVPITVGTDAGDLVVHFNAENISDRLEILFDANTNPSNYTEGNNLPVVADTLFVGDGTVTNQSTPANGVTSNLDLNVYDGNEFPATPQESGTQTITITDSVVASNTGNRTDSVPNGPSRNGSGSSQVGVQNLVYTSDSDTIGTTDLNYADGNIALKFSKPQSTSYIAYLRVSAADANTAWNIYKTEFIQE